MTYQPSPIPTDGITLPTSLDPLIERLAKSNHDVWAAGRIAEGWQHGPVRNDETKEHPDLVPYDKLSESEKAYDRNSVIETLKAIVALGYRIERVG